MDGFVEKIRENFERVSEQLVTAAQSAGRPSGEVRLVVVTKTQPPEVIRAVVDAGVRILGENYPEETVPKMDHLGALPGVEWHMIGHLQSRKAGLVCTRFDRMHSLDSLHLAERMQRHLVESGRVLPVLLEFNVGDEMGKQGWRLGDEANWGDWLGEIEGILALPNLRVEGLMTMPPWSEEAELSRPAFVRLRKLRDFLARRYPQAGWTELSMGTSVDFAVAIQEGATYVRVGTAVVGPRRYH